MTAPIFVDTNVFVYARDLSEPDKQKAAQTWLEVLWNERVGRSSFQVLNEYYVTVTKKLDHPMPVELARQDVQDLLAWNPTDLNVDLLVDTWSVEERFRYSWWDALIVG